MKTYCIDVPVVTYARVRVNGNTPEEAVNNLMESGDYIDWDFCDESPKLKDMMDYPELYSPEYDDFILFDEDNPDEKICVRGWGTK